eukprot:765035-Hanusia_phi.AAC.9
MFVSEHLAIVINGAILLGPTQIVLNHDLPLAPQCLPTSLRSNLNTSNALSFKHHGHAPYRSKNIIRPNRTNSLLIGNGVRSHMISKRIEAILHHSQCARSPYSALYRSPAIVPSKPPLCPHPPTFPGRITQFRSHRSCHTGPVRAGPITVPRRNPAGAALTAVSAWQPCQRETLLCLHGGKEIQCITPSETSGNFRVPGYRIGPSWIARRLPRQISVETITYETDSALCINPGSTGPPR